MAEMTIRLRVNPETLKKDIIVDLRGDDDSLPHEHEQQHRQLVDKLIEGGIISAGEVGNIIVQREEEHEIPNTPVSNPSQEERESHQQGS